MKRKGLLLVEVVIALMILAITAGAYSLSADFWEITPKREAERLFAKLSSLMLKADRTKTSFQLKVESDEIRAIWSGGYRVIEKIPASKGYSYSWNAPNDKLDYDPMTNKYYPGAKITITGKGADYYVIIATNGSRVRISDTYP